MKNPRIQTFLFLTALVMVSLWILMEPLLERREITVARPSTSVLPVQATAAVSPLTREAFARWAERGAGLGALPASLTGTQVDGELRVDANGNLLVELGLRRVFDYFLATLGEESLEQIRARIAHHLQQQLPPTAAAQAWDILNRYLHYKNMLASLPGHDGTYDGMRTNLNLQRELRDSLLGPELAGAFYLDDDQYADFALQHVDQLRATDLSAAQREQRTEALLSTLPEELRTQIQATGAPLLTERQVQVLRDQGASASEIWQHREQRLGADAAERLARLDEQRAQWQQRYDAYRRELSAIEASALDEADKAQEILRLRAEQFTPTEQKRVDALDRITADARTEP